MNSTPHFAVIGAGIAGLACAAALQQAQISVSVFEKSRAPGGRMSTRRGNDWQCDHGAQYFTARHPEFRAEVARWRQAGVAALWEPRLAVIGGEASADRDCVQERFVGVPGMTAPCRFLADALTRSAVGASASSRLVHCRTTIRQLRQSSDGWQLLSGEQRWLEPHFDAVLLALPAPQAAALLQPIAPALAAQAGAARMRGSWALMLHFAEAVALPFDAAFVNHGPLRWIARNNSKPARSGAETWLLHANAEWSEAHLEDDESSVAAPMLQAFAALGGPAPQSWTAHRWRYADSEPALRDGCAWDQGNRLGLCGDWLNGGRVEGAWMSGRLLAGMVIQSNRDAEWKQPRESNLRARQRGEAE